jgi:hypothetical protein
MRCLTESECVTWIKGNGVEAITQDQEIRMVGNFEILFSPPQGSRHKGSLSRDLIRWLGFFEDALLWVKDWPLYKPDEMALVQALRRSHRENRPLIEAIGHWFPSGEREELTGWIFLMMSFCWDSYLFVNPFSGSMLQTSHAELVWFTTSDPEILALAKAGIREYDVKVHRES